MSLPNNIFALYNDVAAMRDLLVLFVHLAVAIVRLIRPGGARAIQQERAIEVDLRPVRDGIIVRFAAD